MRIYVMHRDFYTLKACEVLLSQTKHEVKYFSYLSQLTEAIKQQEPHIVLIDSGIPSLLEDCSVL